MQRSGAATRRFYAAFYQWTVRSANPTRRCTAHSLISRRRQNAAYAAHSRTGVRSYASAATPKDTNEFAGTEELLRSEEVQSIANRPYRTLAAWDHVVRAKAKRSLTLEIAVPGKVLRDKTIRKKAEVFEVQLTVSNFKEGLDNDVLCPVHLKGDYSDVWAIWRRLYQIGHTDEMKSTTTQSANQTDVEPTSHEVQQSSTDVLTDGSDDGQVKDVSSLHGPDDGQVEKVISLPEAFVKPIGKRGTIEYFQSKFGVQAGRLDKYGMYNFMQLKGDTKQVKEVLQFVEELRTYVSRQRRPSVSGSQLAKRPQIIRPNDLRSEDLNYWQSVRRNQLSGRAEEEFCLPELTWQSMRQDGDVKDLELFFGIKIKELEVFDNGKKRCIGLNGIVADVDRAKNWLAEFRITIPEMQADTEYLKIHAGVTGQEIGGEDFATTVVDNETVPEGSSVESTVGQELDAPEKEQVETGSPTTELESQPSDYTVPDYWHPDYEVRRYKIPQSLKRSKTQDPLADIQIRANLKALRYRNALFGRHLQAIGTPHALDLAQDLIQEGIERYNQQHGSTYASIRDLELEIDFAALQPTDFAVVSIPKNDSKAINTRKGMLSSECDVKTSQLRPMNEDFDAMEVVGAEEGIRFALAELQNIVDQNRSEMGGPAVKLEVLHAGKIKATEFDRVYRAEKAASQDLYKAAVPHEELPRSYYAWVSIPSDRSALFKLRDLSEGKPHVSFDWENQVVLRPEKDEEAVALKLEGYRLEVLDAVDSFSRLLYRHPGRHFGENGQARILKIDLVEFMDDGRDTIGNLRHDSTNNSWKPKRVLPTMQRRETAEAPKKRAQSSVEEPETFLVPTNTTPNDGRASEVQAPSKFEDSVAAKTMWKPEHVSATEPHKETAQGFKEHVQPGDEKQKSSAGEMSATPSSREAPEIQARGNGKESVAKAVVDQASEQGKPKLTEAMRTALRHLLQPVAVVTSMQKDSNPNAKADSTLARGVTVSSFCTVTLTPVPVISFNLRVPSRSWDAIASSGLLRVHLLKASPEGAAVAHAFTQRYTKPHEPFEHLAKHPDADIKQGMTPVISWSAAVQTVIIATILPDKCIQVGDHMIVVAKVSQVFLTPQSHSGHEGALAYGMQGYRNLGSGIEPLQIEAPETEQAGEKVQAVASTKSSVKEAPENSSKKMTPKTIEELGPSSPILDQQTLQQVLEETETSYATQSLPSQAAAANRMLAEALKAVQDAYRGTSEPAASSSQAQAPAADQPSKETANEGRPAGVPTFSKGWGLHGNNASQTRTMTTWARSPYRSYSSNSSDPAYPPISKKILKTTVGDYLCQLPAHSKRYADLVNTQRNTERIEAALEENGKLSPEEVADLENEVQISRRRISRELAVRNAQDLCAMLDNGRVVMTRVPFLESNLEQGQAALLAEAKLLRDSLERGGLGAAEFEKAKAALMKDYEYIDAQLMRLRDMVEEDDIDDDEDR